MDGSKRNIFKKGSYIFIEGDEDVDSVYILEDGIVEQKKLNLDVKYYKNNMKKGDIFGFISSLCNRPRLESAFAKTDVSVIEMTKEHFITMLQKNSDIAIKVINYFADELRKYDNLMFSTDESLDKTRDDEKLFELGEYYFNNDIFENAYYILNRYIRLYPNGIMKDSARELIERIESTGLRSISEPVSSGLYREYLDKQIIFCEDEPGEELFLIKSGNVKIVKFHNRNEIMLSVLKENDIFGELAIVSDKLRNATAISHGPTELLPINKDSLIMMMNKSPEILKKIFISISQRVWFTYIRLEAKLYKRALTRIYVFIENKLIEENISLKSKRSYVFNFGINELLNMVYLEQDKVSDEIDEMFNDQNLCFNFGQIKVINASALSAKARFYRSRDNLSATTTAGAEKNKTTEVNEFNNNVDNFDNNSSDSFLDELNGIDDPV